ncbi:MAG: alpha-galactosidase [Lachnospiraceae bacterium]|nr:alpha-galactosidase [Lachnospiraceae bacterium]
MDIFIRYFSEGGSQISSSLENEDYVLTVTERGERTSVMITPKKPITLEDAFISEEFDFEEDCRIFLNGYQSWTETREFSFGESLHNMNRIIPAIKKKFHFENYGDAWFYKYNKNHFHGFTYSYVRCADGRTYLVGSLNEENAYMITHYNKSNHTILLRSDVEGKVLDSEFKLFDFVHYEGKMTDVVRRYFSHFGPCKAPQVRGYTSWYLHYQDINEEKIDAALDGIDADSFDLFQIDDGYETFVGDWTDVDPAKFPDGLGPVVDKIHEKGLKAGIWLAPFVCETKSRVYAEHPDWIVRKDGDSVFAGSNWSGDVALDLTNPEALAYVRGCLEYFKDLGFDFFKLDFLYAAALIAGSDSGGGLTRAEHMRSAMKLLREVLGDRLILGCGVPLSSAFGLVDYCRIGPDVSLRFDDAFYMRAFHRERISTKVTLQNTIFRTFMDGRVFRCDPDVFLLRDDNIKLSKKQRMALSVLNHLCGSVFMTSDNVGDYNESKHKFLREAQKLAAADITDITADGGVITVRFMLDGKKGKIQYDTEKGVLVNGQKHIRIWKSDR